LGFQPTIQFIQLASQIYNHPGFVCDLTIAKGCKSAPAETDNSGPASFAGYPNNGAIFEVAKGSFSLFQE
jgi:hypothetical protein